MIKIQKHTIPDERVASFDILDISNNRHHMSALLECDVTDARAKIRSMRKQGAPVSFNSWLLKIIADTLKDYPMACAYKKNKRTIVSFNSINISFLIEKNQSAERFPVPYVIKEADKKKIANIHQEIEKAKTGGASNNKGKSKFAGLQQLYTLFPGFIRKWFWRYLLSHPKKAFATMGNVAVTSIGGMTNTTGWFIHKTIHPASIGVGAITQKPRVVGNQIVIRDVLHLTLLIDHDVIDGAPMARMTNRLVKNIERGLFL
jgi:pyruvate/2-oxoglutarate dehydrogenase complex dihydrolipoamide acyltransferase (E2) component